MKVLLRVLRDERGSAFIENAIWLVMVVLVVGVAGFALADNGIRTTFDSASGKMSDANTMVDELKFNN